MLKRTYPKYDDFFVIEINSRTVLSLQTCQAMGLVKVLHEVKDANKQLDKKRREEKNEDWRRYEKNEDWRRDENEDKIRRISGKHGESLKEEILKMYPEVFFGLGKLESEYHIVIEMDAEAVVHPLRKIPAMLRKKLKEELDSMEKEGIIVKLEEPTEWVNSLVIVEKPNGDLRLCLDPRELNKVLKSFNYLHSLSTTYI